MDSVTPVTKSYPHLRALSQTTTTMSEKKEDFAGLPTSVELTRLDRSPRCKRTKALVVGLCLGVLGAGGFVLRTIAPKLAAPELSVQTATALCPQAKPITPVKHSAIWDRLTERSATDEHKARAIEWLSGAVRVRYVQRSSLALSPILMTRLELSRTITWSLWAWIPVGMLLDHSTITYWKLSPLCTYFYASESSFWSFSTGSQSFHFIVDQGQHLGFGIRVAGIRRKPQTGLIRRASRCGTFCVRWNASKWPLIDVVPVNPDTVDEWKYPPYSGHYDGMLPPNRGDMILTIYPRREDLGTCQFRRQGRAHRITVGFTPRQVIITVSESVLGLLSRTSSPRDSSRLERLF
jgi:hypothetical protein